MMKASSMMISLCVTTTTILRSSRLLPRAASFNPSPIVQASRRPSVLTTTTKSRLFSSSPAEDIEGPPVPPISPESKRLFMVRHGEVINPGGTKPVYYGAMDVSLSSLGEEEAMIAAEYLKQFQVQHVAASPLSRAKFGANEVLLRQKNDNTDNNDITDNNDTDIDIDIHIYKGFTELDRGAWCGKTKTEIGEDVMTKFDACDESVTPQGGESYPALKKRVLAARDELLHITDCGKASVVVSHLQVTRCMLSDALAIPTEEMYKFNIATASVACVDFNIHTGEQIVHFQNFKPDVGLAQSKDGAN